VKCGGVPLKSVHHRQTAVTSTCLAFPTLRTFDPRSTLRSHWLSATFFAMTLSACGGTDHYAPASLGDNDPAAAAASPNMNASGGGPAETVSITETASSNERGLLDVLAIGALKQSLGLLEFNVKNRAGELLISGHSDVQGADMDRRLLLDLPAGKDYELTLDASGSGESGATCHATVSPLSIAANETAAYQAFLWQCDQASKVPAPADECYWLADWVGATRTHAAVGESVELRVAGEDTSGVAAHVNWVVQAPQYGSISDRHAAKTTFTCEAANDSVPVAVVITGDGCSRRVTLNVSCDAR
jgi:hypothetical protein